MFMCFIDLREKEKYLLKYSIRKIKKGGICKCLKINYFILIFIFLQVKLCE